MSRRTTRSTSTSTQGPLELPPGYGPRSLIPSGFNPDPESIIRRRHVRVQLPTPEASTESHDDDLPLNVIDEDFIVSWILTGLRGHLFSNDSDSKSVYNRIFRIHLPQPSNTPLNTTIPTHSSYRLS